MKNFDYKVNRTENCIMVKTSEWIENNSNLIQTYRLSGRQLPTYFTQVIDENIVDKKFQDSKELLKVGATVLLTRVVSDVAYYRSYEIENEKYYDIPVMQVIGTFKNNIISYDNLNLLYDKIIIEKIDVKEDSILLTLPDNSMIGRVLKVGTCRFDKNWNRIPLTVKEGDIVLIKDNVTTNVVFDSKQYYVTEENSVVGIWNNESNMTLDNIKLINDSILLVENYKEEKESNILLRPDINYEDLDTSDIYNRNIFKVIKKDNNLTRINENDNIFINRDITNYVYYNKMKYFMINGMQYIEGKLF